jgi:hypothetical protein
MYLVDKHGPMRSIRQVLQAVPVRTSLSICIRYWSFDRIDYPNNVPKGRLGFCEECSSHSVLLALCTSSLLFATWIKRTPFITVLT